MRICRWQSARIGCTFVSPRVAESHLDGDNLLLVIDSLAVKLHVDVLDLGLEVILGLNREISRRVSKGPESVVGGLVRAHLQRRG